MRIRYFTSGLLPAGWRRIFSPPCRNRGARLDTGVSVLRRGGFRMTHTLVQDEAEIRALFTEHEEGMRLRSPERIVARYADDVVTATLAPPLRNSGPGARDVESLAGWMAGFEGPITLEHRDVT